MIPARVQVGRKVRANVVDEAPRHSTSDGRHKHLHRGPRVGRVEPADGRYDQAASTRERMAEQVADTMFALSTETQTPFRG
jgi:hypothetical protein